MKIAIISDIHGNNVAMQAVSDEIKKNNVEYILVLGDTVGYYYWPDKVMEILAEYPRDIIKGNHELMMIKAKDDEDYLDGLTKKYGHGIEYALKKLSEKSFTELEQAAENKVIEIDGLSLMMCHGSPWDVNERIYPDLNKNQKNRFKDYKYDFIFFGHSHYPFIFTIGETSVVSVGSVGQSRVKGGVAQWVILDTITKVAIPMATAYDIKPLLEEVKTVDPNNQYLSEILLRK